MTDEVKKATCLVCSKNAATRGLCPKCYAHASGLVKKGETTWEALEAAGLSKPSQRIRSSEPSAFARAYAETCNSKPE